MPPGGTGTLNGELEGFCTALGVIGGLTDGLAVGGAGLLAGAGVTFFCGVVAFGGVLVGVFCGATLWVILLTIDCFLGAAGAGAGDDGAGFAAGFDYGNDTGFFGSLIPPVLEFLSALNLVLGSLGFSSLSTNTNSISLTFGFGFSNRVR